jgi:putative SOS response-associated peptidase YedK
VCYSAQVAQSLHRLVRYFDAHIDYEMYEALLARRLTSDGGIDASVKTARVVDDSFVPGENDQERRIAELIAEYRSRLQLQLQKTMFEQTKRLADAERKLRVKENKTALNEQRVARDKIQSHKELLTRLGTAERDDEDARIFPLWYAPVIVWEGGRRLIRPMRYLCRPAGKPATFDKEFSGAYVARKDNLEGFWRNLFGTHHGILVINGFYENVALHDLERRELRQDEARTNVVLNFRPRPPQDLYVACVWSHWRQPGQPDLYSFAAISDDPPPEIAAAGHNRCPVAIKPQHVDVWLNPVGQSASTLLGVLEDPQRPYFEHRIAA